MRMDLRSVVGAGLVAAGLIAAVGVAAPGRAAVLLDYTVTRPCTVYPNYPVDLAATGAAWWIVPGGTVAWEYNVDGTWSVISDKKYRGTRHPAWGFVRRDCIGTSLGGQRFPAASGVYPAGRVPPVRALRARTADSYRVVDFRPAPARLDERKTVRRLGTLHDSVGGYVTGTVFPGWQVRVAGCHRLGWTKVYVPELNRWGWLQDSLF